MKQSLLKLIKMFKVIITPMALHIIGASETEFANFKEAYSYFAGQCNDKNIDYEEFGEADLPFSAGGTGHDYRIEMEKI